MPGTDWTIAARLIDDAHRARDAERIGNVEYMWSAYKI